MEVFVSNTKSYGQDTRNYGMSSEFCPFRSVRLRKIQHFYLIFWCGKFYGKVQFPQSFGRFARNYAETVPFHKFSTPGNQVKITVFYAV